MVLTVNLLSIQYILDYYTLDQIKSDASTKATKPLNFYSSILWIDD